MDATLERADAITELQAILLATSNIDDLVQAIAQDASHRLAPRAEVTVTLRRHGRMNLAASSGARARRCDEVEYAAADGPCVDAVATLQVVDVPSIERETRWPAWTQAAREVGFRSAAAFPAVAETGVSVAVNVYSEDPEGWMAASSERGAMYASEVGRAVRLSLRVARETETSQDLRTALASRSVIDQAIGVIMAQNRCTSDEAFAILRSASQHRNVKLRDVATAMIESVTGQAPTPTRDFVERAR